MRKKVATVVLLTLFSINFILAQCIKGDCFNGEGTFRAKNGSIYQGTFKLGKFHGKGFVTFSSNDKFLGSFSNGKKNGAGKYIFAAGHEYIGEFVNDKRQGKGKMSYANKDVYQGEWFNDVPQGQGKYFFSDGSSFEGKFTNGNFDGNGILTEANGESYSGTWKNNVLVDRHSNEANSNSDNTSATNTQSKPTSNKIRNCTDQYCDQETGRFDYRDGSYFIGDFTKGEPEGEGTCNYINGDIYKGGWKSHGPHGFGTMLKKDGSVHSGIWELGALKKRSYETEALTKIKQQKEKKSNDFNAEIDIYAVIVGVATYNHMQSLRYTDDDAYHLYAFLKSPEGGAIPDDHISILIDDAATKKNISKEISNIFSKADANDVIMLYMSGHGLEGSFVPVDFDGTNNLLAYKDVLDLINESPAKHKLYITDACHSGSMYASKTPYDMALTDFYTKFKNVKGGTAIITSSKKDEVSLEYSGMRHGVFSHYLINGLKGDANTNADQFVSVEELFNYIYLNVRNHTNNSQTPSIFGDYDKDMPVGVIR
jgi:hypothetical protein